MQHALFGLVLVALLSCGPVFAGDAPSADPAGSQAVRAAGKSPAAQKTRSPAGPLHHARHSQQAPPPSLPLAAAAAAASEPSAGLPIAPVPRAASPEARPWTGFYVGAGVGVGRDNP